MDKLVLAVSLAGVNADTWSGSGQSSGDGSGGFSGSGSGMFGGSYGPDGLPYGLPDPFKPPQCDRHAAGEDKEIQVTMKYISDLSKTLGDDIKNKGKCYNLIRKRIYGSLQLSPSLMTHGRDFLDHFANCDSNEQHRNTYATCVKSQFKESFDECETTACAVEYFCEHLMWDCMTSNHGGYSEEFKNELKHVCMNDGWKFQEFIVNKNTDSCKFEIVPIQFMPKNCEHPWGFGSGSGSGDDSMMGGMGMPDFGSGSGSGNSFASGSGSGNGNFGSGSGNSSGSGSNGSGHGTM